MEVKAFSEEVKTDVEYANEKFPLSQSVWIFTKSRFFHVSELNGSVTMDENKYDLQYKSLSDFL